tara:strand:+ start:1436 stop:3205 length:1770 start_codon:yes stop_codon:yes gene_type:complete
MSNFWTSEERIPIRQTKVSIPAQHGLEYSPGQKCEFHLPATVDFFQPKESYLNLTCQVLKSTVGDPTRLQLDAETGLQVLIRDVRIYSGGSGRQLLEEYQNYNTLVALKYDYETNDSLKAKRGLTEGATVFSAETRSTTGMPQTQQNNLTENPYFKALPKSASFSSAWVNGSFLEVKGLIPLQTGIFQNDKVFPIAMTEGLVVEIIFEEARRVFRTLDQTNRYRHLQANPFFMSTNGSNSAPDFPKANNASLFNEFYVRRDNCQGWSGDISAFPFVVGEEVKFINASTGVDNPSVGSGSATTKIERIEYVGGTTNAIKVRLNGSYRGQQEINQEHVMYSEAVRAATSYNPSYLISNAEFVLQQVEMPPGYTSKLASMMKSGGSMNYDFVSATNYKASQLRSERVANIRLPLVESRAKAILCIPTDASASGTQALLSTVGTYITDFDLESTSLINPWNANHSQRTGLVGVSDQLSTYQLFYDGSLNPSRKVKCGKLSSKKSVDAQPLIELEKALVMGGIMPFSMLKFRENFCIGRPLSLQNGVYDARGKDFALQLEYQEALAPVKDKLWMNWCVHLRRIEIKGDSISLQI